MTNVSQPQFLLADIGGTNTRVALSFGDVLEPSTVRRFQNSKFDGLSALLAQYVSEITPGTIDGACVAVAGPVRDGRAELTNRNWVIESDTVAAPTGARLVTILNDLEAQGYALDRIPENNMTRIMPGAENHKASDRLVVGVGTGFNCAPVHDRSFGKLVTASEAGHANLPVRTDEDLELLRYVETAHGFPAIEDVLSGRGFERVYGWLAQRDGVEADPSAAEIMKACTDQSDPRATHAARIFVRMLGTVVGNLTLVHLPFGGVFLVGGVVQAFAPLLGRFGFAESFADKGRFSEFMMSFPVAVVDDDYAALYGCATSISVRWSHEIPNA